MIMLLYGRTRVFESPRPIHITNNVFTLMGVKEFTFDVVRKSLDKITIYYSYWYFLISFYNDRILGDH